MAASALASDRAPLCAPPRPDPRPARLGLPAGACDAHAHVIGPHTRYALSPARIYTPPECTAPMYLHLLDTLGLHRAVLVQPSIYGSDNTLLLDTLALHPQRLRGVAVVDADVAPHTLQSLHRAGVRGVRLNLVDRHDKAPGLPWDDLRLLAGKIAPLGWHLELLIHVDEHADDLPALTQMGVPVVLAHFGYPSVSATARLKAAQALVQSLAGGQLWLKLTGPYRISAGNLPYPEAQAMADTLRSARTDRLLWGSDWPHVNLRREMPADGDLLDLLAAWIPDAQDRDQVLVHNPQRLYGFDAPA